MLISIDPGSSKSGIALFSFDKQLLNTAYCDNENLFNLLTKKEIKTIVCESFRLYPKHTQSSIWNSFETVETIGVIKYLAEQNDIPIVLQGAHLKKFFDDKKLAKIIDIKGVTKHELDSVRHALYYLTFTLKK